MKHLLLPVALLLGIGTLAAAPAAARDRPDTHPPLPLMCSQLAGDAGGLVGSSGIKSVAAKIGRAHV